MTKAEQKLHADAEKLRDKLAAAQAVVDDLQAKLNRIERKLSGEPPKETGLDMLWNAAPPMARNRSSKVLCRKQWNLIRESERPKIGVVLNAIRAWSRTWDWKKDGGLYVPGLDKWIRDRKWENLPEDTAGSSPRKFESAKAAQPVPDPSASEPVMPDEVAEIFSKITPKRINS
jgi:hypothetical protein